MDIIKLKDLRSYGHSEDVDARITNAIDDLVERIQDADGEYISDIISDIADGSVPVYNTELFSACADLYGAYADGQAEGLIDTSKSLPAQLMQAYYILIEQKLYKALEDCIFNAYAEVFNAGVHSHWQTWQKEHAERACYTYAHELACLEKYAGLRENVKEDIDRIFHD